MRYIGNKTRLLRFIRRVLKERGIQPGVAMDPFCGTAAVSRALKRWNFSVVASDLMEYAYVFARAYVQVPALPTRADLPDGRDLRTILRQLNALTPEEGFIHANYSPGSGSERMYFTPENAGRIDAMRTRIEQWRNSGELSDDAYYILLAALIEAADRVANTTGVYAAYVKSWQPNAVRPLELRRDRMVNGNHCYAHRTDAVQLVTEHEPFDLLYLDPPYNSRQYPGYYHIPELLAVGWFDEAPELRGKTGLLPDEDKRSNWCSRARAERALEELLAGARCKHIVMSYNAEGIIPESSIERLFRQYGLRDTYRRHRTGYRRYRSDADGDNRKYKADSVAEYLYCVSR